MSDCGCHDNRMDKIWWNEPWMGWPIDEHYDESSNVATPGACRASCCSSSANWITNVDPASTMQVVNALIKANKISICWSSPAGPRRRPHQRSDQYGSRRQYDFFVRHLLGVEPPDMNKMRSTATSAKS